MSDQLEVLKLVAASLNSLDIAYMITGSMASSHYAVPRFTRDIDLVVELDQASAGRLVESVSSDFYVDGLALRNAVERAGMTNLIHLRLLVKVDLIVRKDTPYRREEFRRRRSAVLDGETVWFVAPEDLVLSKLVWMRDSGSEIQRRDVKDLLSAVDDLDHEYVDRWAHELDVLKTWREVSGAR